MDTNNAFTITPMSQNIELKAGETYEGTLTIANPADAKQDFYYKITVSPYTVIGEDYKADFATTSAYSEIVNWIKIEEPTGVLKPNESKKVSYKIVVPESAPAGGQYASLMVSSNDEVNAEGGATINNVIEMASIIYADIDGETVRDGKMDEATIPGFVTTMPIQIGTRFTNNGNTHEVAKIDLTVKSFFSSSTIYPESDENGAIAEVIMPGTTRYVTRDITNLSPLGIYEVTQSISYLGENYQIKQTVIACPVWFMALVAVTVGAIITLIIARVKKKRSGRKVF